MDTATRRPLGVTLRLAALASTVLVLASACGGPATPAEEQLRDWVQRGVAAAENKHRQELVSMISPSYADSRGYERDSIEAMLRAYFLRMNSVELVTSIEEISVIGESAAEIMLTVGMAGTHGGVLGFSADAYRFAFELERGDDDWQLISARWGELGKELK